MPALVSLYLPTPSFPSTHQFQKHQHLKPHELNSSLTSSSTILTSLKHIPGASSTGLFCSGTGTETKPEPGVHVSAVVLEYFARSILEHYCQATRSQLTLLFHTNFPPAWQQQLCYFQPKFGPSHPCTRITG